MRISDGIPVDDAIPGRVSCQQFYWLFLEIHVSSRGRVGVIRRLFHTHGMSVRTDIDLQEITLLVKSVKGAALARLAS